MTLAEASVLIVDDEPVLRMTFAIVLRQLGVMVHTAAHGVEALTLLEMEHVDLMLTDKQMPVMDGPTLLNALQARGRTLPSILFVNGVAPEAAADLRRWNVVETVTKPLHPERLIAILKRLLEPLPSPHANAV